MKGALPILLLLLGGGGILLSFLRARSRAVFAQDGFSTLGRPATAGELLRRVAAMLLLAGVLLLTVAIPFALGMAGTEPEARDLSYVSLFGVHATLALFLVCYYLLSGHRSVAGFLCLRSGRPLADLTAGIFIGAAGWLLTILLAALFVGLWYLLAGAPPGGEAAPASHVAPMIVWLVARPAAVKIAIICSAMFIEEFFFRSFLQTRVGPLAATLMFTAAHGAYGQPIVLIGILVISTVLSAAFMLYRNVLPCIVAHGVFDAIQMFVVIPLVLRALPV
ncbi:MAG TPA: CPBP family intramembrane glutamic endopeptidase [Thermoanaerobaculia bacterium]|nr:CPBP family intramembrane glutamic endopeptidase [Thermoanaerobaculia bacterium]